METTCNGSGGDSQRILRVLPACSEDSLRFLEVHTAYLEVPAAGLEGIHSVLGKYLQRVLECSQHALISVLEAPSAYLKRTRSGCGRYAQRVWEVVLAGLECTRSMF